MPDIRDPHERSLSPTDCVDAAGFALVRVTGDIHRGLNKVELLLVDAKQGELASMYDCWIETINVVKQMRRIVSLSAPMLLMLLLTLASVSGLRPLWVFQYSCSFVSSASTASC